MIEELTESQKQDIMSQLRIESLGTLNVNEGVVCIFTYRDIPFAISDFQVDTKDKVLQHIEKSYPGLITSIVDNLKIQAQRWVKSCVCDT